MFFQNLFPRLNIDEPPTPLFTSISTNRYLAYPKYWSSAEKAPLLMEARWHRASSRALRSSKCLIHSSSQPQIDLVPFSPSSTTHDAVTTTFTEWVFLSIFYYGNFLFSLTSGEIFLWFSFLLSQDLDGNVLVSTVGMLSLSVISSNNYQLVCIIMTEKITLPTRAGWFSGDL